MPVVLRQEAVKSRKETVEERLYAPIEKMDRFDFHRVGLELLYKKGRRT